MVATWTFNNCHQGIESW